MIALNLKETLIRHMSELMQQPIDTVLEKRYQRIMGFGVFEESGK